MNNAEKIHHSLRNFLIVIIEIFLHKQVPESPVAKARKLFIARREPYQDCEERTRRDIRRELAAAIESLVTEMSHKDSDLTAIYSDLTESQMERIVWFYTEASTIASRARPFLTRASSRICSM